MRLALVAPLYESVPPALYGGTERMRDYCNIYQRAIETRKEYSWQRN